MDPITHPMTGVLIGAAVARRRRLLYPLVATGVAASFIPDIDAPILHLMDLIGVGDHAEGYFFHKYHRLFTHNLYVILPLAALAAIPAWRWARESHLGIYLLSVSCIIAHLLMDWPCHWWLKIFWPINNYDFASGKPFFNLPARDTYIPVLIAVTITAIAILYWRSNQVDEEQADGGAEEEDQPLEE